MSNWTIRRSECGTYDYVMNEDLDTICTRPVPSSDTTEHDAVMQRLVALPELEAQRAELLGVCDLAEKTVRVVLQDGGSGAWNGGMLEYLQDAAHDAIAKARGEE